MVKPTFTIEEIKAITTTAKDYNMLLAHAHGDEGIQRAILGGIKLLNTELSGGRNDGVDEKYDSYLVPTLAQVRSRKKCRNKWVLP
jgi:hypothetical protein